MDAYFQLLPNELILALSLYFNYRDTILACPFLRCDQVQLWLNKIQQELGYSNEFINEYVYDKTTNLSKTLLPINEKYLELKARSSVDFGTEFYNELLVLVTRSSRIKDFQYARELTLYLIGIVNIIHAESSDILVNYGEAIQGAIGVGNISLADKLIADWVENNPGYDTLNRVTNPIIIGIYELNPNGNTDLLNHFKIPVNNINQNLIIQGLAAGGHLEQLKEFQLNSFDYHLADAIRFNKINIIQHYDLVNKQPYTTQEIIRFGHLELLSYLTTPKDIIIPFIIHGYLEEIHKYKKDIEYIKHYSLYVAYNNV